MAGLRAAETLRGEGFAGEVVVIGAESHLPYDRPPLSKQVLTGKWEPERAMLRQPDAFAALDVDWRLGTRATALDPVRRTITLVAGSSPQAASPGATEVVTYGGAIIATGASPVHLSAALTESLTAAGPTLHVLRTLDDSLALHDRLAGGDRRVVVIGAGFIGLEVAAAARTLGNEVTVIEAASAPLIRGLGADMGRAVSLCHGDHGVDIRCATTVRAIDDRGVVIDNGPVVAADVVVVGIGVRPNTAWLDGSGLLIDDGIVADRYLCVGFPGVYAAGDVVRWPHDLLGETVRVEHWSNAAEQGALAASNLLAEVAGTERQASSSVPFFWSDQYDRRIQFLGRAAPDDDVRVVAGSVEERRFVALYGRSGRLTAVLGLNSPKQVMPYRRLLEERISFDEAVAAIAVGPPAGGADAAS